jgi:molecular chaperone GrpE (heat shock protein)
MAPFDPETFERLAGDHLHAWQGLLSSTAAVAALPLRTVSQLVGWPVETSATLEERLAGAEAAVSALTAALTAEREARRADMRAWQERLEAQHALVAELRQAYARLEQAGATHVEQARQDLRLALYQVLEPLLTQLPLVRHATAEGREVAAADVLALLGPLDRAVAELGLVAIGQVGEEVPFDPQVHQVARGRMPEPGEPAAIRHVGYRLGEQILRRARVSRLPDSPAG